MITHTTVQGRPATVAYFDKDFEPVAADKAALAKVVFTDGKGGAMFLTPPKETNKSVRARAGFDPSEPRDPHGQWTAGGGGDILGPGVHARGTAAAKALKEQWWKASPFQHPDEGPAVAAAHEAQDQLAAAGEAIAKATGAKFINPGAKKDIARIREKIKQRGDGASRVTDLARAAFEVETPAQANRVVEELGKHFGVGEEDWNKREVGYVDKALMVHFPNHIIGEVQLLEPKMLAAKKGAGHKLYKQAQEAARVGDHAKVAEVEAAMAKVYGDVLAGYSDDWKAALGSGGKPGKSARYSASGRGVAS